MSPSVLPSLELAGVEGRRWPNFGRALRDPESYWPERLLHTAAIRADTPSQRLALVTDPQAVTEILLNRDGNFPRSRIYDRILRASYGENLWRGAQQDFRSTRRDLAQPITSDRSAQLVHNIGWAIGRLMGEWDALPHATPINLIRDARRLSMAVLIAGFFAEPDGGRDAMAIHALAESIACEIHNERKGPLPMQLRSLQPLAEHLVAAQGDDEDDPELAINTMILFLHAGHDNVSAALTWCLWIVARDETLQNRLRNEWRSRDTDAANGKSTRSILPLTNSVVCETLRLYSPNMQLFRESNIDMTIGDQEFPAGFTAVLALYAMHRNTLWWDRPDSFDPDRFINQSGTLHERAVWLPFGTGPRGCIGASFAQIELTMALGMIVDCFALSPNPLSPMRCSVDFTLRPAGEAPIFARPLR